MNYCLMWWLTSDFSTKNQSVVTKIFFYISDIFNRYFFEYFLTNECGGGLSVSAALGLLVVAALFADFSS